jgi:hypothetical protein
MTHPRTKSQAAAPDSANASDAANADPGWVRLPRSMMDSAAWPSDATWKIFCWCILKASYRQRFVNVKTGRGEKVVELQPGQFIFGRHEAAKALRMPGTSVADRMARLEQMGFVTIKPVTHYSIVTVCDWETYGGRQTEVRQATVTQPSPNRHKQDSERLGEKDQKRVEPPAASEPGIELVSMKPRKRTREKSPFDALDFAACDFGTLQGITSAIDMLTCAGIIRADHYEQQKRIVLYALMTHRLATENPGGYFRRMVGKGFGKYGPSAADEEKAKAIMKEIQGG